MYVCIHTYVCVCVYARVCVCARGCVCVYVYVCVLQLRGSTAALHRCWRSSGMTARRGSWGRYKLSPLALIRTKNLITPILTRRPDYQHHFEIHLRYLMLQLYVGQIAVLGTSPNPVVDGGPHTIDPPTRRSLHWHLRIRTNQHTWHAKLGYRS